MGWNERKKNREKINYERVFSFYLFYFAFFLVLSFFLSFFLSFYIMYLFVCFLFVCLFFIPQNSSSHRRKRSYAWPMMGRCSLQRSLKSCGANEEISWYRNDVSARNWPTSELPNRKWFVAVRSRPGLARLLCSFPNRACAPFWPCRWPWWCVYA